MVGFGFPFCHGESWLMVVTEAKSERALESFEADAGGLEVHEDRSWELYRAWPNTASVKA